MCFYIHLNVHREDKGIFICVIMDNVNMCLNVIHVNIWEYVYRKICVCISIYTYTYTYTYICVCVCVCMCMCMCIYVYMSWMMLIKHALKEKLHLVLMVHKEAGISHLPLPSPELFNVPCWNIGCLAFVTSFLNVSFWNSISWIKEELHTRPKP